MIFLNFTIAPVSGQPEFDPAEKTTAAVMLQEEDVRKCIPEVVDFFHKQGLKILFLNEARVGHTPNDFTYDQRLERLYRQAAEGGIACEIDVSAA